MIPLIIQDQFYTIQNLQRSPIPQTSNWSGTFFAVSYSKPALADHVMDLRTLSDRAKGQQILRFAIQGKIHYSPCAIAEMYILVMF